MTTDKTEIDEIKTDCPVETEESEPTESVETDGDMLLSEIDAEIAMKETDPDDDGGVTYGDDEEILGDSLLDDDEDKSSEEEQGEESAHAETVQADAEAPVETVDAVSTPVKERATKTRTAAKTSRSAEVKAAERREKTAERQMKKINENAILSGIPRGSIYNEVISHVEAIGSGEFREIAAVVIMEGGFKVYIPFEHMFRKNPIDVAKEFNNLQTRTDVNRYLRRKHTFLERLVDSRISFCVTHYKRDGSTIIFGGSRIKAMDIQRNRAFGGESPRYRVGDVVQARITGVNSSSVVCQLGGVDVIIPKSNLTLRYCLDLRELYQVGEYLTAILTDVRTDEEGNVESIYLNTIRIELENAKKHYYELPENACARGIITGVDENGGYFAYIKSRDLFARIIRFDSNAYGKKLKVGDTVMLIVRKNGHRESGLLYCRAKYDFGNSSLFSGSIYR